MEDMKGNNTEIYFNALFGVKAIHGRNGKFCCFGSPVTGCQKCAHDPDLTEGLIGCNGTGYIYTIASMEAVGHEED